MNDSPTPAGRAAGTGRVSHGHLSRRY